MWDNIFKRWLDLLFWWLPKNERTSPEQPERAPETPSAAAEGKAAPPRAETVERPPATAERPAAPTQPPAAPKTPPAAAQEPPAAPAAPDRPDDLTEIKGIGPAVQDKLRTLGIATFSDLAAADPDRLVDQLKGSQPVSRARVQGWTEAARERTGAAH